MSMVCLGSCFFSMTGQLAFKSSTMGWDAARVAAAIPSGKSYHLCNQLCLIGFGNNTNSYLSFIFNMKLATFRGWIPWSWFDMEGNYYNFTYNCKWGTINKHLSVNTRIDNSGKCLVGSCCRRSCWWRFTSVYCQVRKTFDAQLLTHMYIYYIN